MPIRVMDRRIDGRDQIMRSRLGVAAASFVFLAALATPLGVAADTTGGGSGTGFGTISIKVGPSASLKARLLVTVPVTITCTPPIDAIAVDGTWAAVTIIQASGKTVASGGANFGGFACDGLPHTYSTTIAALTVPFHGGAALVSVAASVCGQLADFNEACTGVTTPWTAVKIAG
jgi:hypothetical protein